MSSPSSPEGDTEPPLLTRDFALVLAVQLAFGFAFSSFFLLPKYVVTELSGSPSQVGYVSAVAVVCSVLASPACGALLDRGARRPLITLGALATALSSAAFLFVSELGPYLYAVRAAQGISFTLFFVAAGTLVADLAPPARLGQALGWFGAAALTMNAVATISAEHLAHRYGWNAVFAAATASGVLATLLSLSLREPQARPQSATLASSATLGVFSGRLSVFWAAAAGGVAFGVMFTFTQPFALSLGDTNVSPLFAGYTATALIVRLAFGSVADRFGRARVGGAALGFYALVVAATAGLFRGGLGYYGIGFGLAHGAFYPSLNALVLENAAPNRRGSITAYFNGAFNAGVLLVTLGCGHLAEAYGYRVVFLAAAAVTASGAISLWSAERRKSTFSRAR